MGTYGSGLYGASHYGEIASLGNWLWELTFSRLATQGSSGRLLLKNTMVTDAEVTLVTDRADALQILLRNTASGHYDLQISDNTASVYAQHTLGVHKWTSAGGDTTLYSTASIDFVRGRYYTICAKIINNVINVYFDGTQIFACTDTSNPLTSSGQFGLYHDGGTNYVYDLCVKPLGQNAEGLIAYNRVRMTSTDPLTSPKITDLVMCVRHPNIATGIVIPETRDWTYKQSVAAALDDIAQQSHFSWRINELAELVMQPRDGSLAPFVLAPANNNIDAATPPQIVRKSPQYRNRQYITNAIDIREEPESKLGNGVDVSWQLKYPVEQLLRVTVSGQEQSIGIRDKQNNTTYYYAKGDKTITLDQEATPPLTQIDFVYLAQIPYTAAAEDLDQQALLATLEQASGIYFASEDGNGILKDAADALAQARLTENAILALTTKLTTRQPGGLAPGQLVIAFLDPYNLKDIQFLLTGINAQIKQHGNGELAYWYDLDLTTGPSIGTWARQFQARLLLKKGGV